MLDVFGWCSDQLAILTEISLNISNKKKKERERQVKPNYDYLKTRPAPILLAPVTHSRKVGSKAPLSWVGDHGTREAENATNLLYWYSATFFLDYVFTWLL